MLMIVSPFFALSELRFRTSFVFKSGCPLHLQPSSKNPVEP
jgi:hypothetical protein